MSIEFVCASCNKLHHAPPEYAGRKARCTCGAVLLVPTIAVPPMSPSPAVSPPNRAQVPPDVAPHLNPNRTAAGPSAGIDPDAWARESPHTRGPLVKTPPLARLLAERRVLFLAAGVGLGGIVLLTPLAWMFFSGGGVSEARRYFPNDCLIVGTANVDEFTSSSFYQQLQKDLPASESGQREIERGMGIALGNIIRITFAAGGKSALSDNAEMVATIRLKKAAAADIKADVKVASFKKDFKYEEVKIAGLTAYEQTYRFSFDGEKGERHHGAAFCLPESTLVVMCPDLETLKRILGRDKPPELSEGMQNAMSATDYTKTFAVAVNFKGLMANETASREVQQSLGAAPGLQGLNEQFLQEVLGLGFDARLGSSKATVSATLLCKEAKSAEDAKKMLDGGQVILRNAMKAQKGVPQEVPDLVDAIKFSVAGANVKGSLQADLAPLSKWIKEQAEKR